MFICIKEVKSKVISERTEDFYCKGGCLNFLVWQTEKLNEQKMLNNKYQIHLSVAQQTIQKLDPFSRLNFKDLDKSGVEVELAEFLGPHYDLQFNKPLIRGIISNETLNSYFYFDEDEISKNKIDFQLFLDKYNASYSWLNGYFIYAFMEPPYTMNIGTTIRQRGEYLLDFINYFFSDMDNIEIMKWSTDCSSFFDAGKEWWGTFYWTVYNPEKDWYIGICGSTTD